MSGNEYVRLEDRWRQPRTTNVKYNSRTNHKNIWIREGERERERERERECQ